MRTIPMMLQSLFLNPVEGNEQIFGARPGINFQLMGGYLLRVNVSCGDRTPGFTGNENNTFGGERAKTTFFGGSFALVDILSLLDKIIEDIDNKVTPLDYTFNETRGTKTASLTFRQEGETMTLQLNAEGDLDIKFPFRTTSKRTITGPNYTQPSRLDESIATLRQWCSMMRSTAEMSSALVTEVREMHDEGSVTVNNPPKTNFDKDTPF
jgi:hypothetical protein